MRTRKRGGTGKATPPLARRGFRITVLELGAGLAAHARANLAGFPRVVVQTGDCTERVVDLVKNIWPQCGFPYRRLSAVAHAELLGMSLNLAPVPPGA